MAPRVSSRASPGARRPRDRPGRRLRPRRRLPALAWRRGAGLMGGSPEDLPERYAAGDPMSLLPLSMPALLVHGTLDATVSVELARGYERAARDAGSEVELVEIAGAAGATVRTSIRAVRPGRRVRLGPPRCCPAPLSPICHLRLSSSDGAGSDGAGVSLVRIHCYGCDSRSPSRRPPCRAACRRPAGPLEHGQTFCPSCARMRGLTVVERPSSTSEGVSRRCGRHEDARAHVQALEPFPFSAALREPRGRGRPVCCGRASACCAETPSCWFSPPWRWPSRCCSAGFRSRSPSGHGGERA